VSGIDKLRSFAESRSADHEMLRDGLSYGDTRDVLARIAELERERDEARRDLVKACIDNPREQPSEYHRQCVETADAWWPGSGEKLFP